MANQSLPEITCPHCHLRQPWRLQARCLHCAKEMKGDARGGQNDTGASVHGVPTVPPHRPAA